MKVPKYLYALGVAAVSGFAMVAAAAEPDLKGIMQGLRNDVVAITDGLLTDDFDKIAAGAAGITTHERIPAGQIQLVAAELGAEMATFKQLDQQVHDLSLSIASAAKEHDRERVATDYRRMLDGCLSCHATYKERVAKALKQ